MVLLEKLREDFKDCITTSCRKGDCALNLDGISMDRIVIVDNDVRNNSLGFSEERLCDYFLFYQTRDLIVAAVELKSGRINPGACIEQIQNGVKEIETLSKEYDVSNFIPLLLYGKRSHAVAIKRIQKAKILFRGRGLLIIIKRCGGSFKHILEEVPPLR